MANLITALVLWLSVLLVPEWEIETIFFTGEDGTVAETAASPDYLTADLYFDTLLIADSAEAVQAVAHELCHVATWELGLMAEEVDYDKAMVYQEQVCTKYERMVWGLINDGFSNQ